MENNPRYDYLLALLPVTSRRSDRAGILQSMAECAEGQSQRLPVGSAAPETGTLIHPLAWAELATLLSRLADAELGIVNSVAGDDPAEVARWQELASAADAGEHAAAAAAITAAMRAAIPEGAAPEGYAYLEGQTVIRPFAVQRWEEAVGACTQGYRAEHPGRLTA